MISNKTHPEYIYQYDNWLKQRYCFIGGDLFRDEYLEQFSVYESSDTFELRRNMTPIPAFAKAAINDVKNSIFQRASDIIRKGGPQSYINAIIGSGGGVDNSDSTMNSFMQQEVLKELLIQGKVGVFCDMPTSIGPTLADRLPNQHPYLYTVWAEDILNWKYVGSNLVSALIRIKNHLNDPDYDLPTDEGEEYWLLKQTPSGILVRKFDNSAKEEMFDEVTLSIPYMPFEILELSNSLLADTASYQIGMLNLSSSDMYYAFKCNFPTYTEQFDPRVEVQNMMKIKEQTEREEGSEQGKTVETGISKGRRYPLGTERPAYIAPPSESLKVSMEKQERMKEDIRQLTSLSLQSLRPKMQSADSRNAENEGLEGGLSAIGFVLERAERKIAKIWAAYEGTKEEVIINYPRKYSLKSDTMILDEAERKNKIIESSPSLTFQKEMAKDVAYTTLGHRVSPELFAQIEKEIDESKAIFVNPETLTQDVINSLVSTDFASVIRHYPPGEAAKAKQESIEKLGAISAYQSKGGINNPDARGVNTGNADLAKNEKELSQNKDMITGPGKRGKGK